MFEGKIKNGYSVNLLDWNGNEINVWMKDKEWILCKPSWLKWERKKIFEGKIKNEAQANLLDFNGNERNLWGKRKKMEIVLTLTEMGIETK